MYIYTHTCIYIIYIYIHTYIHIHIYIYIQYAFIKTLTWFARRPHIIPQFFVSGKESMRLANRNWLGISSMPSRCSRMPMMMCTRSSWDLTVFSSPKNFLSGVSGSCGSSSCCGGYERSILGPKRLLYFFLNNVFNLKGNCVTHIHTYIHTYTQG